MRIWLLIVFLSVFLIANADDDQLPKAPDGFGWYVADNKAGTFLRPDGWFVKEDGKKSDKALFITKENIDKNGVFTTGLSVNRVPRLSKRTGYKATEYAKAFIKKYLQSDFNIINSYKVPEQDTYQGYGVRYSGDNNGVKTIANVLVVASNRDDVVYLMIFESPAKVWDSEWEKGRLMLNMFGLGE